jgi:hypothetical protein
MEPYILLIICKDRKDNLNIVSNQQREFLEKETTPMLKSSGCTQRSASWKWSQPICCRLGAAQHPRDTELFRCP